ncbi:MAG TPA: hypothetical protein VGM91_23210 [Conexibacter sp.]
MFASVGGSWRLHEAERGPVIASVDSVPQVHDLCAAVEPVLWLSTQEAIYRLTLPDLVSAERIPWDGERIGAIACSPDGMRAVVVEHGGDEPRLQMWDGRSWERIAVRTRPDISSGVAWVGDSRIVYETSERRLLLLDIATGAEREGPAGCCPAAAARIGRWYAIAGGRAVSFGAQDADPEPLEGFRMRRPTSLSVTSDGEVCTWTEALELYRVRGYAQRRGGQRRHLPEREHGAAAVIGPYEAP